MTNKRLHIVSFDVPFPDNYGGVIDVFHKLRCLKAQNIDVILHCFEYGRGEQMMLKDLAKEVYYYPRKNNFFNQFSSIPFIVKSRNSNELIDRLLLDDYPILMEGIHSTSILLDDRFKNRKLIFRESNIEHEYYLGLAKAEKKWYKKLYFLIESIKLKKYESNLAKADYLLIVSEEETKYFREKFPQRDVIYLSSFHANDEVSIDLIEEEKPYILFHGNLSVQENILAFYTFLNAQIFDLPYQFIVAGLNPSEELKHVLKQNKHIQFYDSPEQNVMSELIKKAHLHLLYTDQPTGLKLKLINILFTGKFIVCNENMIVGTGKIRGLVALANDMNEYKIKIKELMEKSYELNDLEKRKELLLEFFNQNKTKRLIELI